MSPTFFLGLTALFSSLLGVWRDHLLAQTFGATSGSGLYNLDVYYAAFRIPDLLYFILISGAVSAAFIPLFTQYKKSGQMKKAWEFASNLLNLMLLMVSILALIAFIFAPYLAKLVASGFTPEDFDLTVYLMRILFLSPLLFTFSSFIISLQDSFKTFFFRSLLPIFYNLGIIASIFLLAPEWGVVGLAWGVILGALISLLIQLPALKIIGYRHLWTLNYKAKDIREAFSLMIPRVLTMSMYQFSQMAYTLMASFLALGSITILYFATNIYALPLSMIGVAFSITSFATLSELATGKNTQLFIEEMKRVMQLILFFILPATAGLILLRFEIISTILLFGKFTLQDALITSNVVFILVFSLFTHSLILLLTRGFYACHDTKTPFYASLGGALIGIFIAYVTCFIYGWNILGIALGMSLSNVFTFLWLYLSMRKKMKAALLDALNVFKIFMATLIMSASVYGMKILLSFPPSFLLKLLYLGLMGLIGILVYFGMAYWLGISERDVWKRKRAPIK